MYIIITGIYDYSTSDIREITDKILLAIGFPNGLLMFKRGVN